MSLFTPDTTNLKSFEEKARFLMAWRLSIVFIFLFSFLTIPTLLYTVGEGYLYSIFSAISLFSLIYLHFTKRYIPILFIYVISGTVLLQLSLQFIPDITHYSDFVWIFVAVVFAFISINRTAGWIVLIVNMIGSGIFIFNSLNPHIESMQPHSLSQKMTAYIELLVAFALLGYLINQYVLLQNYLRSQQKKLNSSLEEQNQAVLSQNKENITLIKEVHHRVKNNLQIIISLLRMQRSEIKSEENQEQFSIAINRVLTMSLIHQKLYQEKELSRINITDYITDLSKEILSVANRQVSVEIEKSEEYAGLKTIVPFGLLVNELISNSLKHAYSENENAVIRIDLKQKDSNVIFFSYEDNGEWVEPKEEEVGSFGLELIDVLTEQLDGTYNREGSRYSFEINTTEE